MQTSLPMREQTVEARTIRKVALRIVPFLMICYFVSFVDRVNLGFAALDMVKDLHLSPTVFGFGGGIFFLSYFLCEVPSNLLLARVGGVLSRRHPLHHVLVSRDLPGSRHRVVHGRDSGVQLPRFTDFRRAPRRDRRMDGPSRMAVDVHSRGAARDRPRLSVPGGAA